MSLGVAIATVILAVIFRDVIAMIPSAFVSLIVFISKLNAKNFAIILLIIAGVLILLKNRK